LRFVYDHGLSVPLIFPALHTVQQSLPIKVSAESALRFGVLEGDVVVDARTAVYDPQSAYNPQPFRKNGSKADRLAIVCNRREAFLLTGESELLAAAKRLLATDAADVVVVKCGSSGALVVEPSGEHQVPAFRTDRVWPLGSGDVFAAAFFYHWGHKNRPPADAALRASKATAYYCDTTTLPLPTDDEEYEAYEALSLRSLTTSGRTPRVYLAGPFFNMAQRWLVNESRMALSDQGLDVFSPFHDVGFGVAEEVVPADIAALDQCDLVFALLDQLDSGTLFEIGHARAKGTPVIGFCQNTPNEALKMLIGTGCEILDDFVSAIYRAAWIAFRP